MHVNKFELFLIRYLSHAQICLFSSHLHSKMRMRTLNKSILLKCDSSQEFMQTEHPTSAGTGRRPRTTGRRPGRLDWLGGTGGWAPSGADKTSQNAAIYRLVLCKRRCLISQKLSGFLGSAPIKLDFVTYILTLFCANLVINLGLLKVRLL